MDRDELISGECPQEFMTYFQPSSRAFIQEGVDGCAARHPWSWLDIGGGGQVMPEPAGKPWPKWLRDAHRGLPCLKWPPDDIPEDADAGIRRQRDVATP